MRAASPADAKAVWQSIVKAGGRPSVRAVAKALNASGKFEPISASAVGRWHKSDWKPRKGDEIKLADEAAAVDAAVPALTGEPTTRTVDLLDLGDDEASELDMLADQDLARRLARQAAVSGVMLLRRMQRIDADTLIANPGLGTLYATLSSQIETVHNVLGETGAAGAQTIEGTVEPDDTLLAFQEARARVN